MDSHFQKQRGCSLFLLVLTLAGLISQAAIAVDLPPEIEGKVSITSYAVYSNPENKMKSDKAIINLHLAAKVWTLLGHPVYMCSGWWEIQSLTVAGEVFFADGSFNRGLPAEVLKKVRIWDGKFQLPISSPNNETDINLQCDAGIFGPAGVKKASFNVPGSVGWGNLFFNSYVDSFGLKPIPAKQAQAIMIIPGTRFLNEQGAFHHSNVLQLSINLSSVYDWMNRTEPEYIANETRAIEQTKNESVNDFDSLFDLVDKTEALNEKKASYEKNAADRQAYIQTTNQQQENYNANQQQKSCRQQALDANENWTPLEFINQQQNATRGCFSIRDLTPKRADTGLWGYVTETGDWFIKPTFAEARQFSEQRAAVKPNGGELWGYINFSGELAITANFSFSDEFKEGFAIIYQNGKAGVIDLAGNFVIQPTWHSVQRESLKQFRVVEKVREFKRSRKFKIHCSKGRGPAIDEKVVLVSLNTTTYREGVLDVKGNWLRPLTEYQTNERSSLRGTQYENHCSIVKEL